jgi:hypothetical protein
VFRSQIINIYNVDAYKMFDEKKQLKIERISDNYFGVTVILRFIACDQ